MDFILSKLYYLTMAKVAIIIPTMNRPDFLLRKFRFYELTESPHPLYVQDSSNEENVQKIKDIIKQFKTLDITYQWVPPGKDYVYRILPLIKEKYCFHVGDDDLVIPKTISKCADFLEEHPDYATCSGQQVHIRFRKEDFDKPYGIIERQTRPLNKSLEDEDMLARIKNFWSVSAFMGFTVRRIETEKIMRNLTKHFGLLEDMYEFILYTILIISGKFKVLDELGYVMQISGLRTFSHQLTEDLFTFPNAGEQWKICLAGLSEILQGKGVSEEESLKVVRWMFVLYLTHQLYPVEANWLSARQKESMSASQNSSRAFLKQKTRDLFRKIRRFASSKPVLKKIYYKFNPPHNYVNLPESKYYKDFKLVKDFLENKKPTV